MYTQNTDTHMQTHTCTAGTVGVYMCVKGKPVCYWLRMATRHYRLFTSPDKEKAGGVRGQYTPCNPQLLICLSCLWLSWLRAEWSCAHKCVSVCCTVIMLICVYVLPCLVTVPSYSHLFSRLCVSMNGFTSVVSLLTKSQSEQYIHSQCQTYKKAGMIAHGQL